MQGEISNRLQQTVFGKGLGQILVRSHHAATRAVKEPILGGQHDDGSGLEAWVFLDQRAGLIAIEARHHDVAENNFGLVIGDLSQRIKSVFSKDDLTPRLHEKYLGTATYGVAVVYNHDLDVTQTGKINQFLSPGTIYWCAFLTMHNTTSDLKHHYHETMRPPLVIKVSLVRFI